MVIKPRKASKSPSSGKKIKRYEPRRKRPAPSAELVEAVGEIVGMTRPELDVNQRDQVATVVARGVRPSAGTLGRGSVRHTQRNVERVLKGDVRRTARQQSRLS